MLDKEVGNELHAIVPQIDEKITRGARTEKIIRRRRYIMWLIISSILCHPRKSLTLSMI